MGLQVRKAHLDFLALVGGPPNQVPSDADAATIEQYRVKLEADLNAATNRAYALAAAL